TPIRQAQAFPAYKSPYGPKYFYQTQVAGITARTLVNAGVKAGMFGGVALFAVIFYASGIPRIQEDILMKIPFLSKQYVKEIHPADN
ncbi:hypothetical protein BT67DRAFT_339580, partial [Trichocladium antarcticum]